MIRYRTMPQPTKEKAKFKLRKRHVRRAVIITLYAFVAIVTIIGIVAPAFQ